jgi:hypothetical protein
MFEADIYLRLLHTSILDIYEVFESFWYAVSRDMGAASFRYTSQVAPRFGDSDSLEE